MHKTCLWHREVWQALQVPTPCSLAATAILYRKSSSTNGRTASCMITTFGRSGDSACSPFSFPLPSPRARTPLHIDLDKKKNKCFNNPLSHYTETPRHAENTGPVTSWAAWNHLNLPVLEVLYDVHHQVHVFFGNNNDNALDPWHPATTRQPHKLPELNMKSSKCLPRMAAQ